MNKSALRGEPSYIWRAGQERRLQMILWAFGENIQHNVLENGCGVGTYVAHLESFAGKIIGLERDLERAYEALKSGANILCAAGEHLPFKDEYFHAILSHEVIEHVQDDRKAIQEMVRVLKPGGRVALFCPNRGYPFETHGIFWHGRYLFGNIPLVNYLPRRWRDHLAPHVRVYSHTDIEKLMIGLPVKVIHQDIIFGAYDNIIRRSALIGKSIRALMQSLERTPLGILGLSHFWVIEKLLE